MHVIPTDFPRNTNYAVLYTRILY